MNHFNNLNSYKKTTKLWEEVGILDFVPTLSIISSAMKAYRFLNNVPKVLEIFQEIKNHNLEANIAIYNGLIASLNKQPQLAEHYFRQLLQEAIAPNKETFNIMIDIYSKAGKPENSEILVDHMIKRGIEPDTFTYTSLLRMYGRMGKLDEAERLFFKMRQKVPEQNIICN